MFDELFGTSEHYQFGDNVSHMDASPLVVYVYTLDNLDD